MADKDKVFIFDTTMRDGEQSPGASMSVEEKIQISRVFDEMGIDIIEAGDNPPVNKKKKKGEPTIMARGLLPGARTRFKIGADLFTRIKKNKYT